eukprot:g3513.t1
MASTASPLPEEREHAPREQRLAAAAASEAKAAKSKQLLLLAAVVSLVASRSVDQVLFYRLNFNYSFYVFYLGAVILPIAFLVITVPVVLFRPNSVTPEMRAFPKWKFAIMGLLDTLFNILSTFPVAKLGGSLTNVLSQSVLPINMVLAYFVLKTRFRNNHILGAFLVIYGILVKLMPELFKSSEASSSGAATSSGDDGGADAGWIFLLVFSQVFAAASNVYKEIALKGVDLDEWYMNVWVSIFQLGFGVLCFWQGYVADFMDPLPAIGSCTGCSWSAMVSGANKCFVGYEVEIAGVSNSTCLKNNGVWSASSSAGTTAPSTLVDGETCTLDCGLETPLYIFLAFIVFNITYNMLMLYVFKHGSSTLFVIANAVRLPLVDLLLMWPAVAGASSEMFTHYDGFALVMLVLAIVVYYAQKEGKKRTSGQKAAGGHGGGGGGDDDDEDQPLLGGNIVATTRVSFQDVIGRTRTESSGRTQSSTERGLEEGLLGFGGSGGRGGGRSQRSLHDRRVEEVRRQEAGGAGAPRVRAHSAGGTGARGTRYNFPSFDGTTFD